MLSESIPVTNAIIEVTPNNRYRFRSEVFKRDNGTPTYSSKTSAIKSGRNKYNMETRTAANELVQKKSTKLGRFSLNSNWKARARQIRAKILANLPITASVSICTLQMRKNRVVTSRKLILKFFGFENVFTRSPKDAAIIVRNATGAKTVNTKTIGEFVSSACSATPTGLTQ